MATRKRYYGFTSKILDAIREEVKTTRGAGPASSDYYAKQANPKDGGYAKSNYVKGDGIKSRLPELEKSQFAIQARTNVRQKKIVEQAAEEKREK
jgi:hypothetical protein